METQRYDPEHFERALARLEPTVVNAEIVSVNDDRYNGMERQKLESRLLKVELERAQNERYNAGFFRFLAVAAIFVTGIAFVGSCQEYAHRERMMLYQNGGSYGR